MLQDGAIGYFKKLCVHDGKKHAHSDILCYFTSISAILLKNIIINFIKLICQRKRGQIVQAISNSMTELTLI